MNLLIVDDEKEILDLLSDLIESKFESASIDKASDGIDAVIAITEKNYDLIITDYKMTRMNGAEFVYNLRNIQASQNKDTPVIILSGYLPEVRQMLTENEIILFVEKPYDAEKFLKKIKMLANRKKA